MYILLEVPVNLTSRPPQIYRPGTVYTCISIHMLIFIYRLYRQKMLVEMMRGAGLCLLFFPRNLTSVPTPGAIGRRLWQLGVSSSSESEAEGEGKKGNGVGPGGSGSDGGGDGDGGGRSSSKRKSSKRKKEKRSKKSGSSSTSSKKKHHHHKKRSKKSSKRRCHTPSLPSSFPLLREACSV